jgi:very-short-patch-repair endonuclease
MPTFRKRPIKKARALRNNPTLAERRLWLQLSRRQVEGAKFSRQMSIGPFICDFLCREHRLVIEVDGGQHCENPRDQVRTAFLEQEGYRVIRFWNNDVLGNMDGVLQSIANELRNSPPPAPSREREGMS